MIMCSCCSTAFDLQQHQNQQQQQQQQQQLQHQENSRSTSSGCCNQSKSVENRYHRRIRMRSKSRGGRMISRSPIRRMLPLFRSRTKSLHFSSLLICLIAAVFALIAISPAFSSSSSSSSSNLNELNEAAPARTTNKEAQLMGKLLKSMQISACDGEIMRIKCREDYTIEILTAEQTILPANKIATYSIPQTANTNTSTGNYSVKDTLVIQQQQQTQGSSTGRLDPQQAAPPSSSSSSSQDMSQYCPPTNSNNYYQQQQQQLSLIDQQQQQQQQTLGNARTGNGLTTAAAANIGQSCNAEEANRKALYRETFVKFVRNECHLRNSCQLDLRWPQQQQQQQSEPRSNLTNQTNIDNQNQTSSSSSIVVNGANFSATAAAGAGAGIGRVFNEICPLNRKLAEVIYKCRPQKLTKRTVCRGGELNLECPQDKRLIFAYGSFGAWANDSKSHERCSNEQQQQHQETATSSSTSTSTVINRTQQLTQRNCLANETFAVLANACAFKESCKLQVEPAVLGQTNCPLGQVEYMKVIFTCVNETLIASRSTSATTAAAAASVGPNGSSLTMATNASTYAMSQARARSINGAPNTSSSSLSLNSSTISSPSSLQTTTTNSLMGPQQQQQQQQNQKSSIIVLASSGGKHDDNKQHDNDDDDDGQQQLILANHHHGNSNNNMDATNSNIFTLVNEQDDSHYQQQQQQQLNRSTRNSNQSSLEQRARYVLAHYPQLLPFMAMLCLSMIIMGFVIKSCSTNSRRHRRRGSNSSVDGCSKDSKDSSVGKSSSSSGFKSLGSSAALMQNGPSSQSTNGSGSGIGCGAAAAQLAALKHHSFSESCFSLDDADFGTVTTGATDSPGLPQLPYNFNTNNNTDDNTIAAGHNYQPATIRPKLWTIHDHHHHHHHPNSSSNSLLRTTHNSSNHHHHHQSLVQQQQQQANVVNANLALSNTLRSHTRTFVGHQAATTTIATQIGANLHHPHLHSHPNHNFQQQNLPNVAANSHHHSHQQQPMQPAPPHQFAYQQLGSVSNAADLLLAMATNHHHHHHQHQQHQHQNIQQQQQQQQAATTPPNSSTSNWCATLTQGQPEEEVANQLAVLSMPPPPMASIEVANFTNLSADNDNTMQNQETFLLQQQQQQHEQQQQQQQQ